MKAVTIAWLTGICLADICVVNAQTRPEPKIPMAEDVFKNIKVLRGIPVNEFMSTMGFFSASLGENCTFCHVEESGGSWEKYADDNAHKQTARRMIGMVSAINKNFFGGQRLMTCYSCHRGAERPKITPNLAELYGPPTPLEPDAVLDAHTDAPSADQILDRYLEALGGAQRLGALTSFTAKGTYMGYADTEKRAIEIFAKAPAQRTTIIRTGNGDHTTVFDGRAGWSAVPLTDRPVPLLPLTGGDLEAARLDAELSFPSGIKKTLTNLRAGFSTIDDREVFALQAATERRLPVKLYFDKKSALLVRLVRYSDSAVGLIPTQIDFTDYREVGGVKMPIRWTTTWLDGRSITELAEVQPNARIDGMRFQKPAAAPPRKP